MRRLQSVLALGILLATVGACGGGSSTDAGASPLPDAAMGGAATGGSTGTQIDTGGATTGGSSGTLVGSGGIVTGGSGGTLVGSGGVAAGGSTGTLVDSGGATTGGSTGTLVGSGGVATGGGTGGTARTGGSAAGGAATGGSTRTGGTGGSSGTATGGSSGGTGACNYPTCLSDLLFSCVPDGTCVSQGGLTYQGTSTTDPVMVDNSCYSNGVKVLTVAIPGSYSTTTVEKNGTVCYKKLGGSTTTIYGPSPAGALVATYVTDTTARTVTITCTGASPVVISLDCMTSSSKADGGTPCTPGTCD